MQHRRLAWWKFGLVLLTAGSFALAGPALRVSSSQGEETKLQKDITVAGDVQRALDGLPSPRIVSLEVDGVPSFVTGDLGHLDRKSSKATESDFAGALAAIAPVFRLHANDLKLKRVQKDDLNWTHVRYRQTKNGLDVVGGELIIHVNAEGLVYAANGSARDGIDISATATITIEGAVLAALDARRAYEVTAGKPRLIYLLSSKNHSMHLAFEVLLEGTDPEGAPVRDRVYIDAGDGSLLEIHPEVYSALNRAVYIPNPIKPTLLPGDLARAEGSPPIGDSVVDTNYDNLGTTYNCYRAMFNRDSIDNQGGTISSTVHSGGGGASWTAGQAVFGDGNGISWSPSGNALDIVAHELTHGVTENTSGLIYANESGGLNEAMSDIFGATVEACARGVNDNTWKIAEEAWTPGVFGDALRYMNDPARDGASLDYYPNYAGQDVHFSSGIANLAFYLLSAGGTHPRGRTTVNVPALGIGTASQIFYRANSFYLGPDSTFAGARMATAQAAKDLRSAAAVAAVHKAWDAVAVPGGPPPDDALVVSQSVPTFMSAGNLYNVPVTIGNTGNNTWMSGTYSITSLNPGTWGIDRVDLPASVPPGSQVTFNIGVTAPPFGGTYLFEWKMKREGFGTFGDSSPVAITVRAAVDSAEFLSQSVPANMNPGQSYVVSVVMRNAGSSIWSAAAGYALGSQNPTNNTTWGLNRVAMPTTVIPGVQASFSFFVTAPSTPGVYNFQWRMVGPAGSFGQLSPNVSVNVGGVPSSPNFLTAVTVSNSQINLSWIDLGNNETGFKIERKTGSGSYVQIATVSANVGSYLNTGLAPTTNYCYRVRAFNTGGNSGYTNESCAITPDQPPSPPTNLNLVSGCGHVDLWWDDNSNNETGFIVERREGSYGAFTEYYRTPANEPYFSDDGQFTIYTSYHYRVRAYNSAGSSAPSNEVFVFMTCLE